MIFCDDESCIFPRLGWLIRIILALVLAILFRLDVSNKVCRVVSLAPWSIVHYRWLRFVVVLVTIDSCRTALNAGVSDIDKTQRTQMHNAIRQHYPSLQSATSTGEDGIQRITVSKAGSGQQSRKRSRWPSERTGDYVRFVLYKENADSHFALSLISRKLGIKADRVALAGTKDRRAVTTQLATIYRVPADKLASLNSQLRGIKVGDFQYCQDQLYLGDAGGNRFTVVMRNVQSTEKALEEDLAEWRERGFVNFYGTQRFGTTTVPTCQVGKAILRKRWEEVVDLLLHPREHSPEGMAECYRVWASTRDPTEALAAIPSNRRHTCLEGLLLGGLKKHGLKDFANAFRFVPRNSRTLYVHSFQSLVWNKLVARRVAKYGQKLLPGDLVTANGGEEETETGVLSEQEAATTDAFRLRVPLASADAQFANEEMLRWFTDILDKEGVTREDLRKAEKEYAVHGGLRRVFVKPLDAAHRFYRYADPTVPLVLTDLDVLRGKAEPETIENGPYLALSLSFSLPAGSYATMAIRELCRMDTGKEYQSGLNDYARNAHVAESESSLAPEED